MEDLTVVKYHAIEQRSQAWYDNRLAKKGGSNAKDIIDLGNGCRLKTDLNKNGTLKSKTPILGAVADVVSELLTGFSNSNSFVNEQMQWGIDNEPEAFKLLENERTFQVGGVTNSDYKYFWLSPDLLEGHKKAFEVKCPTSKTFVMYVLKDVLPAEHTIQCLSYFVVMPELQELDFVAFDPRVSGKQKFVKKITREEYKNEIENFGNALKEFDKMVDEALIKLRGSNDER